MSKFTRKNHQPKTLRTQRPKCYHPQCTTPQGRTADSGGNSCLQRDQPGSSITGISILFIIDTTATHKISPAILERCGPKVLKEVGARSKGQRLKTIGIDSECGRNVVAEGGNRSCDGVAVVADGGQYSCNIVAAQVTWGRRLLRDM